MKKIVTLSAILLGCIAVNAQDGVKIEPAKPVVDAKAAVVSEIKAAPAEDNLTIKEVEFNFGKIPQGKPVTHIFDVVNGGKEPLKIINVQASCGCTTPEWEHDKVVPAGGTTKITVGYNAAAEGPFTKPITITYNGSLSKQIMIKGEVWKTPAESAPANKAIEGLKN